MPKIDEYHRQGGLHKHFAHETAFEDAQKRKVKLKQLRLRLRRKGMAVKVERNVKRYGEIPDDEDRVKTLSQAQKEAYDLICKSLDVLGAVKWTTLRTIGVRKSTLKALVKEKLIQVTGDDNIIHYINETTAQQILNDWHKAHNTKKEGV